MLLRKKVEIEKWLNQYNIKKYELIEDEKYGYVVNSNDNIDLTNNDLKSIDVKFNKIDGYFYCGDNQLTSLEGCPEIVNGDFFCHYNKLLTLIYCPKRIKGSVLCHNNLLESLKGCPKMVNGNFSCNNNKLKSLEGCPKIVKRIFYCGDNKLTIKSIYCNFPEEIENNCIDLEGNKELGKLQYIEDFNELKEILNIYKEKANLMSVLEVTDKSVIIDKIMKI